MSRFLMFIFAVAAIGAIGASSAGHTQAAIVFAIAGGCALVLWITFLPTFIAYWRAHPNRVPILLLNIFFGWTILGWVAALIWACLALPERARERGFADRIEPTL